jgi:hypothetical protein
MVCRETIDFAWRDFASCRRKSALAGSAAAFTAVHAGTPSNICQPAQCRAKTDTSAAHQRCAENFGVIGLKCSRKPRRDLSTAEHRARCAVAIGRVLIPGSIPNRVGANRPEIRVAAENDTIPDDNHTAGPAPYAVKHLDVNGIKSIPHCDPVVEIFAIRQTLNQNSQTDAMTASICQVWHNPAAGGTRKSRGAFGSTLSFCCNDARRRVRIAYWRVKWRRAI